MSYLFIQTLVIQFFVGFAFLLLGLWGGKFLWGHDRHPAQPSPADKDEDSAGKPVVAALEEELRRLRALIGKLEKENGTLREKRAGKEALVSESVAILDAAETPEIFEEPEEKEAAAPGVAAAAKPERPEKAGKPERPSAKAERDELIEIRGIGKVMAVSLEKRGIRTYRQIAAWTKEEIAKLPYGSRVVRDKWQVQARRLHREKYGEKL